MGTRRLLRLTLASMLLIAAFSAVACVPGQGSAPAAFDMKVTLDKYLSTLPDGWGMITPAALKELLSGPVFVVDVREAKEMAEGGYIEGSVNIPIRSLMKNLDKFPAVDKPIIVICSSGHRSALAMEALQLLGYNNVKSLASGFSAWKAANLPFVTGTPPQAKAGQLRKVDRELLSVLDKYLGSLPDGWSLIGPATMKDLLATSQPFQLDVRETTEIAESGYIAGSTSIPIRTLVKNLDRLPPDKGATVITECSNGHRSAMTMMVLNLLGYTNVRSLAGGISACGVTGPPLCK